MNSTVNNDGKCAFDTIVVGLGAAGAAASARLARAGRRVLALDAQPYVGGRVRTLSLSDADGKVELGAEWIHGERPSPVYDLAMKHNVTLKLQNRTMAVYCSDGSLGDADLVNELMEYTFEVLHEDPAQYESIGAFLTRKITEYLNSNKPQALVNKDQLDEMFQLINLLYNDYEGTSDWNEICADTQYRELDGEQDWSWHRLGYSTLFDILLNNNSYRSGVPGLDIKLNTEVSNIAWPQESADRVVVTCKNGEVFTADNVIVTISVGALKERHNLLFTPALPEEKVKAIEVIPMGVIDKIILFFNEPWWPSDQTFFAFLWRKEDKINVPKENLWTTKIYGATCSMGSDNVLILWTNGDTARMVETLSEETVRLQSMLLLQRFLGRGRTLPEPAAMLRTSWHSNPYTRGSFTYDSLELVRRPHSRSALGRPLRDTVGRPRVLFAGEATHRTMFSTVHGAVDTGYREANRILTNDTTEGEEML